MGNALTLRTMSPGLQEVVVRDVATSHIGGRAGCGKSARPDLVRGRVGQPPGLLYNTFFAPPPRPHAPFRRPLLARGDRASPSPPRLPAAVARSQAWCGNARPGHAAQDG